MVNKKGSKSAKGGKSKPPVNKKPQQTARPEVQAHQQTPQERVALVRPLWETLEQNERVKLLTVDLESVRSRAKQLAEAARKQAVADAPEGEPLDPSLLELEPSIEDVLEEGIKRLKEKGTWKLWQWPADNTAIYDAESFRQYITEKHIREELRRLLPRDEGRATEKPAEAAFRQRMLDLLAKVQQSSSANSLRPTVTASGDDGASRPHRRRGDPGSHLRDANIELLAMLLEALARENDHLYHSLLTPITTYVMEILPEGHRETTKLELSFEDLENLLPDDVSRIVEWLTEKVDALSTKLKPEPKDEEEEEEENMGDVDLWALTDDDVGLTVNARWLQHLQDRLLGEDGHPRRAKAGEDPNRNGLVLEWVYGSIVSTAEKARDGAKRCLGMQPPTAMDAHMTLVRALEEHLSWESRAKQCKDLLSEMLKSRLEAAELTKQGYDLRPQPTPQPGRRDLPGGEAGAASLTSPLLLEDGAAAPGGDSKPLPDEVILFMLRREALLTRSKLHWLVFEHLTQEKELRILKQQLRQGEPEFERLKRELDEVKHQPRMEGAYRNAAEMERHRHQVEIQTAFREQGARLQATYDKKQKAEYDMAKRETEIKQLQGWKGTVENLVDKFQELINSRNERLAAANSSAEGPRDGGSLETDGDLEAAAGSLTPQQYIQLTKMRNHFLKDVRKQLYGDADDRLFFDNLKTALKAIERRLEDSSVSLQHLEMQLINVACDDPGALIGTQLALPLLQDRLDGRGLEYAAQRAKLAEDEVLKMELLAAEREAAERERKKAAKAKKNEKVKSEKERLAAERQAKEEAERKAKEEAERERAVREEEERRKRVELAEAQRKADEAERERRRQELLQDPHGYWRQRMMMEERLSGMGTVSSDREAAAASPSQEQTEEPEHAGSSSQEDARPGADGEEGFVTENRRRRHKDTRDQDEEVAPAAPAPGGPGSRANARSGSRDRMGPREGSAPRERGESAHGQHNHRERDRDREPRRHHGSSQGNSHRSGSREVGGRHSSSQGGAGQPPPRPPSALPAAPPTPADAAVSPAPVPPAEPSAAASAAQAAPDAAPSTPAERSEQPAAPASAAPSAASPGPEAEPGVAAAAAEPAAAAAPGETLHFGGFEVRIPVPVPTPTPVAPAPQPTEPAASASEAAASTSQPQPQAPHQPGPGGRPEPAAAPATAPSAPPPQQPLVVQQQAPPQPQAGQPPAGPSPAPQPAGQPQVPVQAPIGQPGQPLHPMIAAPSGPIPGPMPAMVSGAPAMPMMPPMAGPPPAGQAAGPRPAMGAPPQFIHPNGPMPVHAGHLRQLPGPPPPPPGTVLLQPGARPPMPGHGLPPGLPPQVLQMPQPQPGGPMVRPPVMPGPGPQVSLVAVPHPQGPPGQPQQPGMPPNAGPRGAPGPQQFVPMPFPGPGHMHAAGMPPPHAHPTQPGGPMGQAAPPPHGVYAYPPIMPAMSGQLVPQPHMLHPVLPPGALQVHMPPPPIQLPQQPPQQPGMQGPQGVAPGGQPPPPPKSPSAAAVGNRSGKPSSTLSATAAPFVPKSSTPATSSGGAAPQQQQQVGTSQASQQQGQRAGYQRQNSSAAATGEASSSGAGQAPTLQASQQQHQGSFQRGGSGQQPSSPYNGRRDRRDGPRGGAGPRDGAAAAGGSAGGRKGGPPGVHGMMPQQPLPPGEMAFGQPMAPYPYPAIPPQPTLIAPQPWLPHGQMVLQPAPMPHGPGMEQGDAGNATGLTPVVGPLEPRASDVSDDGTRPSAAAESTSGQPGSGPPPMPPPSHGPGPHHIPQPPAMPALPTGMVPPGGGRPMLTPPGVPMALPGPMRPPMMGPHFQMVAVPMPPPAGAPVPFDGPEHLNAEAAELMRAPRAAQSPAAAAPAADGGAARDGSDSAATASAIAPEHQTKEDHPGAACARQRDDAPFNQEEKEAAQKAPDLPAAVAAEGKPGVEEQATSSAAPQGDSINGRAPASANAAASGSGAAAAAPPGRASPASAPAAAPGPPSWSAVAARREAPAAASSSTSGSPQDAFPSLVPSGGAAADSAHPSGPVSSSSWKAKLQQNVAPAAASGLQAAPGSGRSPTALPNGAAGSVRGSSPRATMNGSVQLAASLSDSAMAHRSSGGGAAPPRPAGNRPTGSALLTGPASQLLGSLSLPSAAPGSNVPVAPGAAAPAIVYHPGVGGKPRRLQLLRGLQNLGGQNNCFLNVAIQSLWHLRCFREAMLGMDVEAVAARGAAPSDVAVLSSLAGIFRAMAAPVSEAQSWAVSPAPLREALSSLKAGQAAVQLESGEMHDASEVMDVLLTCMHRAEAGSGASQGQDPQLPRRVRVRALSNGAVANGHAAAPAQAQPAPQGGGGWAAAVAGSKGGAAAGGGSKGGATAGVPRTAVHSLFGLEVQRAVPSSAEDDDASSSGSSGGGVAGKGRARRDSCNGGAAGPESSPPSAPPARQGSVTSGGGAGRPAADEASAMEVEVFTKWHHLVHVPPLREAFAALGATDGGAFFEDVLCAAEAAGAGNLLRGGLTGSGSRRGMAAAAAAAGQGAANGHGPAGGWAPGSTAAGHPLATLLRFPSVFTLALGWESAKATPDKLRPALEALGPRLDLALLFRFGGGGPAPHSAPCELRAVICYGDHHYMVFALNEELGLWLLIDDANIQLVGDWGNVVKAMWAKRLQPSLLFYEAEMQVPAQQVA